MEKCCPLEMFVVTKSLGGHALSSTSPKMKLFPAPSCFFSHTILDGNHHPGRVNDLAILILGPRYGVRHHRVNLERDQNLDS